MGSKNRLFAEGLADAVEVSSEAAARQTRLGMGVLAGRNNRLAELATGSVVSRAHELVDPGRCRMWSGHNRDYAALTEARCEDLIESLKAQGRQEVPAIVRRVRDDPACDFEVICGARRHWSVSWLRSHHYPDFRFLVEVREITDEEAFRLADIENRARADISDFERARDYLRALDTYYDGRQATMAERIKVTPSWLSRYLDLARLPAELTHAFANVHDLGIKHVTLLKPLLKPDERRQRVLIAAQQIAKYRDEGKASLTVPEVIRSLALAADPPNRSGSPKRTGTSSEVVQGLNGKTMLRVERHAAGGLSFSLPAKSGASRSEINAAIGAILDKHWS